MAENRSGSSYDRNNGAREQHHRQGGVPSPYNFVPLSKEVFFPEWAEQVSHDIPFSDGVCGMIDIAVEAVTPIYIRSGGAHPEKPEDRLDDPKTQDFFRVHDDGQYAIPGTSVKGMLRNVLEIASFGKMSRVDDNRYGLRDLYNRLYTKHITIVDAKTRAYEPLALSGWLTESESGEWHLLPCDFARIEQEVINKAIPGANLGHQKESGVDKHKRLQGKTEAFTFEIGKLEPHKHSRSSLIYRLATIKPGGTKGSIVVTGQPSRRDGRPGKKHMEFVFFNTGNSTIPVPERIRKEFVFIHSEQSSAHSKPQPNEEWSYWKKRLEAGERVPVFYLPDNNGKVDSMGLAMMFRLPYKDSIHDAIRHTSPDHLDDRRLDMAETIFGRVSGQDALRGRCTVTALVAEGSPRTEETVTTILNAPKPTFYPNYIEQPQAKADGTLTGDYMTLMNKDCRLRGWKRYPVRKSGLGKVIPSPDQRKVSTSFRPLPAGTVFRGRIHLHNLRPSELGAIAWALTFGGSDRCCHSLGMAKPYGYGVVRVAIKGAQLKCIDGSDVDLASAMEVFVKLMESEVGLSEGWSSSIQIKSLLAMADPSRTDPSTLHYPILERSRNDFAEIKKARRVLKPVIKP